LGTSTVAGNFEYRVTLESLMDRLDTNMQEACLQIDKECRWGNILFGSFWLTLCIFLMAKYVCRNYTVYIKKI